MQNPSTRLLKVQAASSSSQNTAVGLLEAKQAALYSRATGTVKNIGFMCFMMWMSGSQIHLFSIMMTVSGIYQPLAAIMNSKQSVPPNAKTSALIIIFSLDQP